MIGIGCRSTALQYYVFKDACVPLHPLVLFSEQGKDKSAREVEDALEHACTVADDEGREVVAADVLKVRALRAHPPPKGFRARTMHKV